MGIDAIAIIRCRAPQLLNTPTTQALRFSVVGIGHDFAKLYTALRFADLEANPVLARTLARQIVEALPHGTHEERLLHFYPDTAEPTSQTYFALIAELGGTALGVSVAPLGHEEIVLAQKAQEKLLEDMLSRIQALRDAERAGVGGPATDSPLKPLGAEGVEAVSENLRVRPDLLRVPSMQDDADGAKLLPPDVRAKLLDPANRALLGAAHQKAHEKGARLAQLIDSESASAPTTTAGDSMSKRRPKKQT